MNPRCSFPGGVDAAMISEVLVALVAQGHVQRMRSSPTVMEVPTFRSSTLALHDCHVERLALEAGAVTLFSSHAIPMPLLLRWPNFPLTLILLITKIKGSHLIKSLPLVQETVLSS